MGGSWEDPRLVLARFSSPIRIQTQRARLPHVATGETRSHLSPRCRPVRAPAPRRACASCIHTAASRRIGRLPPPSPTVASTLLPPRMSPTLSMPGPPTSPCTRYSTNPCKQGGSAEARNTACNGTPTPLRWARRPLRICRWQGSQGPVVLTRNSDRLGPRKDGCGEARYPRGVLQRQAQEQEAEAHGRCRQEARAQQ